MIYNVVNFWYTAKSFMYIFIYIYIYIYTFFFIFSSIIVYYKILNIVPYTIQWGLSLYLFCIYSLILNEGRTPHILGLEKRSDVGTNSDKCY